MIIKLATIAGLLFVATGAAIYYHQDQDKIQTDTTPFMQRKLTDAKDVVSGLATEDFELISKSAQHLMLLSQEADWQVLTTEEYLNMSNEFRNSARRLRDNAKNENLDGATLAYFEVTLNCVRCHKYLRNR